MNERNVNAATGELNAARYRSFRDACNVTDVLQSYERTQKEQFLQTSYTSINISPGVHIKNKF